MAHFDHSASASVAPLRQCCGPLAALVQPLITVGMLLFLYAGWHVRDEGGIGAGLRVAFVNTRAYRIDHEHEREAAMLQTELHYAADTDKLIDESLAGLLGYAPLAARVQLGVVHNGVTGVTGVALLRYDVTNSVAAPGKTVGALLLNQPLSDWNNFLPVLLAGRCFLGFVAEQPNPALRARFEALGAGTFMACPVIDNRSRMLGTLFVTWDVRDLPPTGDTLQAVMKHALAVGAQVAAALDLRGRMSPVRRGSRIAVRFESTGPPAMTPTIASALMPLLRRLDPERAHDIALHALRLGLAGRAAGGDDPALAVVALGRRFANPLGLAAGFDKNAVAVAALARLGFGFIETGTVTPRPQAGNARPRLFRLEPDDAVINRMGFNNAGLEAYRVRLARLPRGQIVLGANVGINKDGADPERDYPMLIAAVAPHADYAVINVSSPNTPGLRDLQGEAQLRGILRALAEQVPRRPPVLVKIAPDLADDALAALVETCVTEGAQGLIVSNTTVSRPSGLRSSLAREAGGLSGTPLFALSTAVLARAYLLARGRLTLIGVGGVSTGEQALTKIRAGATLVQLYTGFAYAGPALIPRLKRELAAALHAGGFASVQEAVGKDAPRLAEYD